MPYSVFLDSFTCLDDLKGKDRADPKKILATLAKTGRFSCFDVDDRMARAMTWLCRESGWITTKHDEIVKDKDGHGQTMRSLYPYTVVELTEKGKAALLER